MMQVTHPLPVRSGMLQVRPRNSPATLPGAATAAVRATGRSGMLQVTPRNSPVTLLDVTTAAGGAPGQLVPRNDQEWYR